MRFNAPKSTGIVFEETKPRGLEGHGYELMGYKMRFYEMEVVHLELPLHRPPTTVGTRFVAPLFGITTAVVYTTPAPNQILVPLLYPLNWARHSEAVVRWSHLWWRLPSPKLCKRLVTWY